MRDGERSVDIYIMLIAEGLNDGKRTDKSALGPCRSVHIPMQLLLMSVFFVVLYYDQQMHKYFTNYHTPTCFNTVVSSSGSW